MSNNKTRIPKIKSTYEVILGLMGYDFYFWIKANNAKEAKEIAIELLFKDEESFKTARKINSIKACLEIQNEIPKGKSGTCYEIGT